MGIRLHQAPAALQSEFAKRNTKAMALSIDPIEEHYRCAPDIGEVTGTDPIATPADWRPGDRVTVAMAVSTEHAKERFQNVEELKPHLRYADAP